MRISDWSSDVCSSDLAKRKAHWPFCRRSRFANPILMTALPAKRIGQSNFVLALASASSQRKSTQRGGGLTMAHMAMGQAPASTARSDRTSVVSGKSVTVREELGGRSLKQKKNKKP